MKLYDAEWAPSPRRVRVYLAEKGIKVDRVAVDLRSNEQLSDAFLKINPRATVPALALDDGEIITESEAICRYFEALHPEPPLFGRTPLEIARISSWTSVIESQGYAAAVYTLRNTRSAFADRATPGVRAAMPQIPELATRGAIMWGGFVEELDAQLSASEWVAGDDYSFADITALVAIDFATRTKLAVPEGCGAIARWHAATGARPSASA